VQGARVILIINKELSEDLYEDGFLNIVNIDFSPTVVKFMESRYKENGYNIQCKIFTLMYV
jgi:hypothetical protein